MALGTPVSIGTGTANGPGADSTLAHSGITAGDLVVFGFASKDDFLVTIISVEVGAEAFTEAISDYRSGIWYLKATADHAAGNIIITFSDASEGKWAWAAARVTGVADSPLDKTAQATGTGTTPSSGATATTSQASEFCFGVVGTQGPVADNAGTWSGSFASPLSRTGVGGGSAAATVATSYLNSTSAAAITASKTGITSRMWGACVATFKAETAVVTNSGRINQPIATLVGASWGTNNWWMQRSLLDDDG
jgi:hypothetical protein